jgi:hypothetical protein
VAGLNNKSRFTFLAALYLFLQLSDCGGLCQDFWHRNPQRGVPGEILGGKMATAVDQKLLRQTKFPPEFNQKVDMRKVNIEVMKK